MSFTFDDLSKCLTEIESHGLNQDGLIGKQVFNRPKHQEIVLTFVPNWGPALLVFPSGKSIKDLKQFSLQGLEIRNINLSINGGDEKEWLGILCRDVSPHFRAPFLRLVEDLLSAFDLDPVPIDGSAAVIRKVLNKWRLFWSEMNFEFTEEWIKGLWGELKILLWLIREFGPQAVVYWTGPEKMDHDFQGGAVGVEVKTTETMPPILNINNLRQLDETLFDALYVVVCLVTKDEMGQSLDEMAREVTSQIVDEPELMEIFWRKMAAIGYRPFHEEFYRKSRYRGVNQPIWYEVNSNFPKIISNSFAGALDARIKEIRYRVELAGIPMANDLTKIKKTLGKMMNIVG